MSGTSRDQILASIGDRSSKIGVMGMGYVGLPAAAVLAEAGFRVIGFDVDQSRIDMILKGISYISDIDSGLLSRLVQEGLVSGTTDFSRLSECDVVMICVPTPFTRNKNPDVSYVIEASENIARCLRKGQLIVLRSTTFPETTEKLVLPVLNQKGLTVGKDFWLAFSPERVDPGNKEFTMKNTPVVVGGVTPECTEIAEALFLATCDNIVTVSTPRAAEMAKLLENIFRSVNIALVNELARLCDRMGRLDIWEVIDAAATKPFGFMPFYPGPGIGGHCIPVDPYYLSSKAKEYDFHTNFIELAAETNEEMPYYVVSMTVDALSRTGVLPRDASVLVLGVSFKKDIGDTRNSPALRVIRLLSHRVREVKFNDPYVESITIENEGLRSVELNDDLLKKVDCVLITAGHSCYDYERIVGLAKLVVDTRNASKGVEGEGVVRLGAVTRDRT